MQDNTTKIAVMAPATLVITATHISPLHCFIYDLQSNSIVVCIFNCAVIEPSYQCLVGLDTNDESKVSVMLYQITYLH